MNNLRKQASKQANKPLTKEKTDCLKGVLAIAVLIHHLYQSSGMLRGTICGYILQAVGCWTVAEFFFLSGHGLTVSYHKKGEPYIKQFVKSRIIPFYIVEILLTGIYMVRNCVLSENLSKKIIIQSFLFGDTVIDGGWYLQMQLVLYILWFLVYKISVRDGLKQRMILAGILIICFAMNVLGYTITWYGGIVSFYLGALWAEHEKNITLFLSERINWIGCLILSGIVFNIMYVCGRLLVNYKIGVIAHIISMTAFAICATTFACKTSVECKLTRFLGKISFEIYGIQFLFLDIYRRSKIYSNSIGIYILLVIISTVATAWVLHPVTEKVYHRCRSH